MILYRRLGHPASWLPEGREGHFALSFYLEGGRVDQGYQSPHLTLLVTIQVGEARQFTAKRWPGK
ncbi:MAG: hypothetical protein IPN92_18290 [Chromatiaceae bacterium]|nr:hypothetical protein [Chromatiaceae bacterium]